MKKDIIFIGKQGSGKGTQSKLLAQDFGYRIFETGQALRDIAQQDTELGQKVKEITQRGDLVPNEIVMEIVREFLAGTDASTPVIFDGIPRSEPQRVSLEEELAKAERDYVVIELTLDNDKAVARLLDRGRSDDKPDAIKKRLENFDAYTAPLIEVWREQGKVLTVDGNTSIEAGQKEIRELLNLE